MSIVKRGAILVVRKSWGLGKSGRSRNHVQSKKYFQSSRDLPGLHLGDILEISAASLEQPFYVQHVHEDTEGGTFRERRIYVEKSIADTFSLSQNQCVEVKIVEKKQVSWVN